MKKKNLHGTPRSKAEGPADKAEAKQGLGQDGRVVALFRRVDLVPSEVVKWAMQYSSKVRSV